MLVRERNQAAVAKHGNIIRPPRRPTGMRTLTLLAASVMMAQDAGTGVKQPAVDYYDSISDYFRQSRRAVDLIVKKGIPDEEIPAVLYIARRSSAKAIASRRSSSQIAQWGDPSCLAQTRT